MRAARRSMEVKHGEFTVTYEPTTMCGERGYSYECFCGHRLVFTGWSRGHRRNAEADVRNAINTRKADLADRFDAIDWEAIATKELAR